MSLQYIIEDVSSVLSSIKGDTKRARLTKPTRIEAPGTSMYLCFYLNNIATDGPTMRRVMVEIREKLQPKYTVRVRQKVLHGTARSHPTRDVFVQVYINAGMLVQNDAIHNDDDEFITSRFQICHYQEHQGGAWRYGMAKIKEFGQYELDFVLTEDGDRIHTVYNFTLTEGPNSYIEFMNPMIPILPNRPRRIAPLVNLNTAHLDSTLYMRPIWLGVTKWESKVGTHTENSWKRQLRLQVEKQLALPRMAEAKPVIWPKVWKEYRRHLKKHKPRAAFEFAISQFVSVDKLKPKAEHPF